MSAGTHAARHALGRGLWRRPGGIVVIALAVVLGLIGSGVLVWHASYAAFSSTTSNGANSWTAGTVTLSDDDAAAVMFNATGLKPGSTGTSCITVNYTGNLSTAGVKLYIKAGDLVKGGAGPSYLSDYLTMTVAEGSDTNPTTFGDCTGFVASNTIINAVHLSSIATTNTNYATGAGVWAPAASGSKVYEFTYTLDASAPSSVAGLNDTATFTWEAQNN